MSSTENIYHLQVGWPGSKLPIWRIDRVAIDSNFACKQGLNYHIVYCSWSSAIIIHHWNISSHLIDDMIQKYNWLADLENKNIKGRDELLNAHHDNAFSFQNPR